MGRYPQSFEVYGFTIEVHAGGRRVWPPSFKRFIKENLDRGDLSVGDVMKECNVSQSLVYKWRADVKASRIRAAAVHEARFFSEIRIEGDGPGDSSSHAPGNQIHLSRRASVISFPATYPVDDLVELILALEARG